MSVISTSELETGGERKEYSPLVPRTCCGSVLDVCCGSRMFWFDRKNPNAIFADKRRESHTLKDKSSRGGSRTLEVNPDVIADFTNLPWPDNKFALVVFDPPHLVRAGKKGWQAKKYGKLEGDWKEMLRLGFAECFRVLRPEGTLIFKWNEHEVPVSQILALTPAVPLFGNRCGKTSKSHWIVYMKHNYGTKFGVRFFPRRGQFRGSLAFHGFGKIFTIWRGSPCLK